MLGGVGPAARVSWLCMVLYFIGGCLSEALPMRSWSRQECVRRHAHPRSLEPRHCIYVACCLWRSCCDLLVSRPPCFAHDSRTQLFLLFFLPERLSQDNLVSTNTSHTTASTQEQRQCRILKQHSSPLPKTKTLPDCTPSSLMPQGGCYAVFFPFAYCSFIHQPVAAPSTPHTQP